MLTTPVRLTGNMMVKVYIWVVGGVMYAIEGCGHAGLGGVG